eukprot:1183772-Prorocentrum_minimum.AAC.1
MARTIKEARIYSHNGPIRCKKRGYILTTDQLGAGAEAAAGSARGAEGTRGTRHTATRSSRVQQTKWRESDGARRAGYTLSPHLIGPIRLRTYGKSCMHTAGWCTAAARQGSPKSGGTRPRAGQLGGPASRGLSLTVCGLMCTQVNQLLKCAKAHLPRNHPTIAHVHLRHGDACFEAALAKGVGGLIGNRRLASRASLRTGTVKAPGAEDMLARALEAYQKAYKVLVILWDRRHPDVVAICEKTNRTKSMLEQAR